MQIVQPMTPRQGRQEPATARPNYILHDDKDKPQQGYNTQLQTSNLIQEMMLECIDITKPTFDITPTKLATCKFPMIWLCEMANSVISEKGKRLEYWHLITNPKTRVTWTHSYGNKLGRLVQGMPSQAKETDMIFFIPQHMVPKKRAKDVTYGLITCLIRPEKIEEPNRTRLVTGGDRVHYPFDAGTPTANLLTVKLIINSMTLTPGARFFTMDIKNFYLSTPMSQYAYMWLKILDMLEDIIEQYKLVDIANPGRICLLQNPEHVWASPSRDHCTGTLSPTVEEAWLLAKQDYAWTVDT